MYELPAGWGVWISSPATINRQHRIEPRCTVSESSQGYTHPKNANTMLAAGDAEQVNEMNRIGYLTLSHKSQGKNQRRGDKRKEKIQVDQSQREPASPILTPCPANTLNTRCRKSITQFPSQLSPTVIKPCPMTAIFPSTTICPRHQSSSSNPSLCASK